MENDKSIRVNILKNPVKHFLFFSIYILSCIAIFFYLLPKVTSTFFLIIVILVFISLLLFPLIFEKRFRAPFLQDSKVIFKKYSLSVIPSDLSSIANTTIEFKQIKLFKTIPADRNDFSTLKLVLWNGRKLKYIFTDQKNTSNSKTDINNIFKELVLEYNQSNEADKRIKIADNFWATQFALYLLWTIGIAMIAFIIYFGIKSPKTLFISFVLPLLFYSITLIRKQAFKDKELFN